MHRGVSYMPRSAIHCGRITVILKGPLLSAACSTAWFASPRSNAVTSKWSSRTRQDLISSTIRTVKELGRKAQKEFQSFGIAELGVGPTKVRKVPQDSGQLPGRKGFSAIPELPRRDLIGQFWGFDSDRILKFVLREIILSQEIQMPQAAADPWAIACSNSSRLAGSSFSASCCDRSRQS